MQIMPYSEEYKGEVISCLQRNFEWMGECSADEVEKWIDPLFSYRWDACSDILAGGYKYKHGAVLKDNERVVGFLGMIIAQRRDEKGEYFCSAPTTWAIDEKYRISLIPLLKELIPTEMLSVDFSPRKSVELILRNFYGFKDCGGIQYRLLPVPNDTNNVELRFIDDESAIDDEIIKREFIDHKQFYGVRLAEISTHMSSEKCYLFYKRYDEDSMRIRILKISYALVFAEYCHEIIWKIYRNEFSDGHTDFELYGEILSNMYDRKKICIECDEFMLRGNQLRYPHIKSRNMVRLWREYDGHRNLDYMYTEMAMLSNRIQ